MESDNMRNLLDSKRCPKFSPSFDNKECEFYEYATDDKMDTLHGVCGFCKQQGAYRCVADITRIVPLSHSSTGDFCTCHYLYYLKKILGIELRPAAMSVPLKAGTLWDSIKQKHLGAKINIQELIDKYEIDDLTKAKVRALYHVYKYLDIKTEAGYELQSKINMTHEIVLPASAFIPSVSVGKEAINLWQDRANQADDLRRWNFPLTVSGFYDRKYSTYFTEDKLSGRPEFYLDPFFLQSQIGTYFLADPKLEYCVMEIVQFPQQKGRKKIEETPEQIYKRVYDEVLSRPSNYFIGYDREKNMYGKKFYRGEFDIAGIAERYKQIVIEILAARWTGNFYKNWKACNNVLPGIPCDMKYICANGNVSEQLYKIREKN